MTGERVEDTRTLQPGDRVRVEVEGVIREPRQWMSGSFLVGLEAGGVRPTGDDICLPVEHPQVEVYRLPKPLPPEPPVGAEVVSRHMDMVFRRTEEDWCSVTTCSAAMGCPSNHEIWADVLANFGPVRLLGDPIEAP